MKMSEQPTKEDKLTWDLMGVLSSQQIKIGQHALLILISSTRSDTEDSLEDFFTYVESWEPRQLHVYDNSPMPPPRPPDQHDLTYHQVIDASMKPVREMIKLLVKQDDSVIQEGLASLVRLYVAWATYPLQEFFKDVRRCVSEPAPH